MKRITITPGELDDIKFRHEFEYFTIGRGKKRYHFVTIANNSCGLYYALRLFKDGSLGARRAMEPTTPIHCFVN